MNIFLLDRDIQKCARYHCDRHVIKMLLESTQILCTVLHLNGKDAPYKPSHQRHPCVIWAGQSLENWHWLRSLVFALNEEYKYRYAKIQDHASFKVAKMLERPRLPAIGLSENPQVMPEEYQISNDSVQSYRAFYIACKSHIATWRKRKKPFWYMTT